MEVLHHSSRKSLARALMMALCLAGAVGAAQAAPAEEHARAFKAFQQGDVATAMALLREPVRAGHAPSQTLLGCILDRADFAAEAAQLWTLAAAQGDPEAHAGLGQLHLAGRGLAKDEKHALQHFSEAAALGHSPSAEVVATAWIRGEMGADAQTDPAQARMAITRAADAGHLPSADALALAYSQGRYGLVADAARAAAWRERAAAWRAQRAATLKPVAQR